MEFETISFKGMSSHAHARTICSGSAVTSAVSALHFLKSYSLFTPTSGIFSNFLIDLIHLIYICNLYLTFIKLNHF